MILKEDNKVACPACHSVFHFGHFGEWIRQKGECPVCYAKIVTDY
ncbi:MAG: hypothetical protein JSV04_08725 [Candidatus Heimdallarchaeota archaeon]|nr:MAG: hypothetical protein JSV04_08725 [Candidatus Heimdallarchaeota archaeon]